MNKFITPLAKNEISNLLSRNDANALCICINVFNLPEFSLHFMGLPKHSIILSTDPMVFVLNKSNIELAQLIKRIDFDKSLKEFIIIYNERKHLELFADA